MSELEWVGKPAVETGVIEREFALHGNGRTVPGVLWLSAAADAPEPLVLHGHGGSGHKRADNVLRSARKTVTECGIAVAAIDGPVHGDRATPESEALREHDRDAWRREFLEGNTYNEMAQDWKATLDALSALDEIDASRIGYRGFSMGTRYGIPFVAAEPRIKVAALGLNSSQRERLMADAPKIQCPVLFIQQLEDELMPRNAVLELFDAIGTSDKRLHANPGAHAAVPPDEQDAIRAFLAGHLNAHE